MEKANKLPQQLGFVVYGLISLSLGLISITMIGIALWSVWLSTHEKTMFVTALLDAIGLIVIGMAVFDVSIFLLEKEVFHSHDNKSHSKERETLLKFLVIISIAVSLEALVFIFETGKKDVTMLIYPTFLLIATVFLVISLGVYQKLSQGEPH